MNINDFLLAGFMILSPANLIDHRQELDVNINQIKSIECLALNMYHEARGQGSAGLLAVTSVVLNRVKDKRFPNTICEVIYEGPMKESWKNKGTFYPIRGKCQFSWWCDGKSDEPKNKKIYNKIFEIAKSIYNTKNIVDITDGALFYHADYVRPSWAKTKTKTIEIQDHIFYKWDK
jgi:N-acetylmuramoyl-L-alanine amidase